MKENEIYKDGDIVSFLRMLVNSHKGRGAFNVIMAKANERLQQKIIEATSFLNDEQFSFVNMQTRIYMIINDMSLNDFPRCCTCGKILKNNVASLQRGFIYDACSVKCAANRKGRSEQIRSTKQERYGDPNYNNASKISQTLKNLPIEQKNAMQQQQKQSRQKHTDEDPMFKDKIVAKSKQTRFEKYGDENYNNRSQISATKQRKKNEDPDYYSQQVAKGKQTKLEKYGDENYNNKEKRKKTSLECYGDENWNNREQATKTCLEKYGVDNPAKSEQAKEKTRCTCLELYGATSYFASEQHKQQSQKTSLEKYGVKSPMQCKALHQKTIYAKNAKLYDKIMCSCDEVELLSSKDELIAKTELTEFTWHCKKCGNAFQAKLAMQWKRKGGHWARCLKCYPLHMSCSLKEIEMREFIKSLCPNDDIVANDRHAIIPYEIDVLDKTKSIGFEFNGIYWHSSLSGSRMSMLEKTKLCDKAGIKLVHMLEDEWDQRKEQCKAKIREVLGLYDNIDDYFEIVTIRRHIAQDFLDANCYDLFAKASAKRFAAMSSTGAILAYVGVSETNGSVMLHNLCCAIGYVNDKTIEKLIQHISLLHKDKHIYVKFDRRWPLSMQLCEKMQFIKCTQPTAWLIDEHLNRICNASQKYAFKDTCATMFGCGYCIYEVIV